MKFGMIEQRTWAAWSFGYALNDLHTLTTLWNAKTGRKPGRPDESLEVLNRAGIILLVSAWETYAEDVLIELVAKQLEKASDPHEIIHTFNGVAKDWLGSGKGNGPKPNDLVRWTGDRWKTMISDKLRADIERLNTPSSEKVARLFDKYLDLKIGEAWRWRGVTSSEACCRLDALIDLRGRIAHRSKSLMPQKSVGVRRDQLDKAKSLLKHLVQCTERAVYPIAFKKNGGRETH